MCHATLPEPGKDGAKFLTFFNFYVLSLKLFTKVPTDYEIMSIRAFILVLFLRNERKFLAGFLDFRLTIGVYLTERNRFERYRA